MLERQIGPYRVRALLGAGGMGDVYRARDTRLGRDVALKVIKRGTLNDPHAIARFQREARVLASLNHPHIAAIYGVEDAGGERALVLEFVDGDTLAERLRGSALPMTEALTIARQIADALDAAHARRIVHRDLKPANIKITPAGVVKVLDFGLAKTTGDPASSADGERPTAARDDTRPGTILGTVGYMSPEQARGQPVDKRADVWAFGCVLFEMLSGRQAFAQKTFSDTIAAILTREPAWDVLPAATPRGIRRLIRRCLEKDAKRRLRDIGDARMELDEALVTADRPSRPRRSPAPRRRTGAAPPARRSRRPPVRITIGPRNDAPFDVDAVAVEDDTCNVVSASPEFQVPRETVGHAAAVLDYAAPHALGSVVVKPGRPLLFQAIVHDLARQPSCTEASVRTALANVFLEAERRRLKAIALMPIGKQYRSLDPARFMEIFHDVLARATLRSVERIWLVVPESFGT